MRGEVRTLTMKQAVNLAMQQNPDLMLLRFDEAKANQAVRIARDPFSPKAGLGSGLAYTNGFPQSVEGSAPSIIQARVQMSLFNKPQSYRVAQERENARSIKHEVAGKRDEVAERVALAYLDADRAGRLARIASKQVEALIQVLETVKARVGEGRAIRLDQMQAELDLQKARDRAELLASDTALAEKTLAFLLGMDPGDRAQASPDQAAVYELPESEDAAVKLALDNSSDLKKLQSQLLAKGYEGQASRAAWLPRADLIAQYGLFSRFNNLDQYFNRFQRNNFQIGASFQVPLLAGSAANALARQADADVSKLRTQVSLTRSRADLETRRAFQQVKNAERFLALARLDLEVAREQVSVALAKLEEGRATQREIEQARFLENEKWIAFHEAQVTLEKAQISLLRYAGTLQTALR
jgi:outer membrane protein TolC